MINIQVVYVICDAYSVCRKHHFTYAQMIRLNYSKCVLCEKLFYTYMCVFVYFEQS